MNQHNTDLFGLLIIAVLVMFALVIIWDAVASYECIKSGELLAICVNQ